MSEVIEFGFDDNKVIRQSGVERWKQNKGEVDRVSIVSFKKYHEVILAQKTKENGGPLGEKEKAELIEKIDKNLAEKLGKPINELTEIDKLNPSKPKLFLTYTHFKDGVGLIRCFSAYEGQNVIKASDCCQKIGDAVQTAATVIMKYPVDDDKLVDMEIFSKRRYTNFYVWRLNEPKYKKLESIYKSAGKDGSQILDMKVSIDGDPKYQKQFIEDGGVATWAKEDTNPEIRKWVLEQGHRASKHVDDHLGYQIKRDQFLEKIGTALPPSDNEKPAAPMDYSALLD